MVHKAFLLLAGILAGFALIVLPILLVPTPGTLLALLALIITVIGVIAVVVFSLVLILKALKAIFSKCKH
ncbi:hypothetical protein [Jeotgalibacillus proteolyticus]|uniref:Uncharacterized protein n=1 Tax=Jeotgalibacillus proteolyticus TaxID=2082395 RepID=A0A2S5GD16_9BACL|nr:hypothetical protein [Jeotgalibacillus proteolyticus]PPA70848.1 hypothetical protein C4B60_08635 [Jeotgalibacillus proteolyticus]